MAEPLSTPREAGTVVRVVLSNVGKSTWVPAAEASGGGDAVQLVLRWRAAGRRSADHDQRLDLPWPLDGRSLLESRKSVAPQPVVIRSRGKTFAFDRPTLVSAFSASLERRQVMASLHGGPGASDDSD